MPYDYRADRMTWNPAAEEYAKRQTEKRRREQSFDVRCSRNCDHPGHKWKRPAMRRDRRRKDREHERRHRLQRSPEIHWHPVPSARCELCYAPCLLREGVARCKEHLSSAKCTGCNEIKQTSDFPPKNTARGHASRCRQCKREHETGKVARERRLRSRYTKACRSINVPPVVERWTVDELTARWGDECHYCGGDWTDVDHYVPIAEGGHHTIENCRPACSNCNNAKRAAMPTEWAASILMVELRKRSIELPHESLELIRSLAA